MITLRGWGGRCQGFGERGHTPEREVRSVAYQLDTAGIPIYPDLGDFDLKSSEVNDALILQLHLGEFIDKAHNLV